MTLNSRLCHVVGLICALASLAMACPSQAQEPLPTDLFSIFKNLGGREVPLRSKKVVPRARSNKHQAQASFDCRRAKLPSEKTICTHPDLAALDRQMDDMYARQLDAADVRTRQELAVEQRQWLTQRDACGTDEVCLSDAIGKRLAALSPSSDPAQPVDAPASPTSSGNFQMLQDVDLPYGDYRSGLQDPSLRGVTLGTCETQCTLDDRCQSFTYNVKARACLLKQEVPTGQPFRGAVSGIKLAGATAAVVANDAQPTNVVAPTTGGADATAPLPGAPAGQQSTPIDQPVACEPRPKDGSRFVCTSGMLTKLDARMAASVSAILGSNMIPRDFEASQLRWIGLRNACANDLCLSDLYEKRLGELADFLPTTNPPDLVDPGMLKNTQALSVAWSIPMLRGRLYLPVPDLGDHSFARHEKTVTMAWTRFMLAAGLAAKPELVPHYNEDSLSLIACVLLDEAAVHELGGDEIYRRIYLSNNSQDDGQYLASGTLIRLFPGAEFTVHDFAQRFATERLSAIVAAAPKPPFELVVLVPAGVSSYDMATKRFRISPQIMPDQGYKLLGVTTDLVLKNVDWPLPEAEARAFAARQEGSYKAVIAIPMTVTGTEPGAIYGLSGLPGGYHWQIKAGDPVLYDDQRLTTRLYAFPPRARLPRVVVDTGGAVPLQGDVPLDDETVMLLLLRNKLVSPNSIDWATEAEQRYDKEHDLLDQPDRRSIDPWGPFFSGPPHEKPELVTLFRDWTMRRALSLPDKVVLRQRSFAQAPGGGFVALGPGLAVYPYAPLLDALASKGLGFNNLLGTHFSVGSGSRDIIAVSPLALTSYVLPQPAPQQQPGGAETLMETVLQLGRVETVANTTLIHVTPLSAWFRTGEGITSTVTFPSPAEQDRVSAAAAQAAAEAASKAQQAADDAKAAKAAAAEAEKAKAAAEAEKAKAEAEAEAVEKIERDAADQAARAAAAAPVPAAPPQPAASLQAATQAYGPDLIGVRIGMSFKEAEDIVRKHMEVGKVLDGRRAFDNEIKSGFNMPLTSGKLFISKDNREFIALIDEPPAADKRVVAAWRRIYAPAETYEPEELFSRIKEKYGPPIIAGGLMGNWYEADANNCSWLLQVNPKHLAETWMDAGRPANIAVPNRSAYSNAGPFFPIRFYDPLSQKPSDCGPVVYAAIFKAQPPISPMTELDMTLTDLDNYVAAYSESRKLLQAQAAKAGASVGDGSPAIKF